LTEDNNRKEILESDKIIELAQDNIEKELNKPKPDQDILDDLKTELSNLRLKRQEILFGHQNGIDITLTLNFKDSLIHFDGEQIDPIPAPPPLGGVDTSNMPPVPGEQGTFSGGIVDGFNDNTFALYCGD